jgi:phosphoribosylaminoimidazole (AIR) synthetase
MKDYTIISMGDGDISSSNFLVKFQKQITEKALQEKVDKIKEHFYKIKFEDWCYQDIVDELEEKGYLKQYPFRETFNIYA